jgi:non-heme chloroperoxidase
MTRDTKSVELPTGVSLSYVEQGDASGVPLLLLHGVTDSWRSFELVLPHLPNSVRAFALTQRGHGDSSRPAAGYRFKDFSSDVAAFMDAVGIDAAVVAGHSMGSVIAQRFAIDKPDRVRQLVLIDSFAVMRGNPGVREIWDFVSSTPGDSVDEAFVREFQQSTLAQPVPPEFFEAVVRESLKVPLFVWRAVFQGFLEEDNSDELSKIKNPTLIVWGDQDTFCTRSDQQTLTDAIRDSRLIVYHGAGHAPHWEEPERFARDLNEFIRS